MLISADWHLTEDPNEAYRWDIFATVAHWMRANPGESVAILGDLADRKDRHSAALLNRVLAKFEELAALLKGDAMILLFPGNHDLPLLGASFWTFLGKIPGVEFCSEPAVYGDLLVLPFVANPAEEWADIDFSEYACVFMHQPVDGARDFGSTVDIHGTPMPKFPRGLRIYSGDIHTYQTVRMITYVGAPHPVKFGDRYPCRLLVLDDKWEIAEEIKLLPLRRHMLRVGSLEQLAQAKVRSGDQAKVIFEVALGSMKQWPATRDEIQTWAKRQGVQLFSIEPTVQMPDVRVGGKLVEDIYYGASDPQETLVAFAEEEGLAEPVLELGMGFLQTARERRRA